ncbi:MAG TPA: hypothetical protein VLG47_06875 [Candidatus Saccharimonadales bacterium]|nr:hypothetical protein [Candidatus Saccharimonadales bacterium]
MNSHNLRPVPVAAFASFPWHQYPDAMTAASNIIGVNFLNLQMVGSGELVRDLEGTDAYWSGRFKHCSALVMRSCVSAGFDFAHCWPDAQEILRPMRHDAALIPAEAAFIYGSNSPVQHDLELFLAARGTILHTIHTETGADGADFGVLVDNQTGVVSVFREDPDKVAFQYEPFG